MNQYADIIVFDKSGQLTLIVEVKNKRGTSNQWAAQMRRNMYAHDLLPNAPYFLLALPDRFYLWKNVSRIPEVLEPTQEVDPQPFLQPYYDGLGISANDLTGRSFEFVVTSWLNRILTATISQDLSDKNQDWLISSGLFGKLIGGRLELAAAA